MEKRNRHIALLMTAAVLLLNSCSHDDATVEQSVSEPVEQGTPIAFSSNTQEEKSVTRAPLKDKVQVFKVYGFKNNGPVGSPYSAYQEVFPGYLVKWVANTAGTSTTNTNDWEYVNQQDVGQDEQTIKYWDWSAKAYRFFAVTAGAGNPTSSDGVAGHKESFTMTADASDETAIKNTPYFSKLWFSTGSEALYPTRLFGKPVQLEFMKPFARVRFMFTYSYEPEGNKIKTKSFKPTDGSEIALKGSFTVSYPLTGNEREESYSVMPKANPAAGETLDAFTEEYIVDGTEKWYTVLPNNTQDSYTMTIRMTNDSQDKTAVVPAEYMQWLPGYSYTYIFKITELGGVEIELVQSAYTGWTENEMDRSVYNW